MLQFYTNKHTKGICAKESTLFKESFKKDGTGSLSVRSSLHRVKPTDMDAGVEDGRREVFGGF